MSIEETVMVVGAGQMGSGIAQVFAQSGYTVLLHDTEEEQIHRAISSMTKQLTKRAEKESWHIRQSVILHSDWLFQQI